MNKTNSWWWKKYYPSEMSPHQLTKSPWNENTYIHTPIIIINNNNTINNNGNDNVKKSL